MVAFIFNYIPAIGSIIASIPTPTRFIDDNGGPGLSIAVLIGYLAINVVLGNFVEPMLLGKRFGISAMVAFCSFLGWLWGITGMFLAVLNDVVKSIIK